MIEKIMVKVRSSENCLIFHTVTRKKKSSQFYVLRDELLSLREEPQVTVYDGSFAVFRREPNQETVSIRFFWIYASDSHDITGWDQTVKLPYEELMTFVEDSAYECGRQEWHTLSIETRNTPRFVFYSTRNLHDALSDKLTRRKLCKFLRDNFHWCNCTEIQFYDDFVPRSFLFREIRNDNAGIVGGLILHGQEDMAKAYYAVHT